MGSPRKMIPRLVFAACVGAPVGAFADATLAGSIEAQLDGRRVVLPLLHTDIVANVQGDLANVKVIQTFENPLSLPVHARYLFPLNKDAAIHRMTLRVGDELIRARIEQVEQAQRTFAKARSEGKAAALLKQARPNMFTQDIANLMPGMPIRVEIEYAQTVPRVDGQYRLTVPLVVGPRFQPPAAGTRPEPKELAEIQVIESNSGRWSVKPPPAYPDVFGLTVPDAIEPARVSVRVRLEAGVAVASVASKTHRVMIDSPSAMVREVSLAQGRTIDNRDFELDYALAGSATQAGVLSHFSAQGGFFSLLIEPPASPAETQIAAREMVFLLDCSGSMNGLPMQASKSFMREALKSLRPTDSFRIIRFSDAATEFSRTPLPATPLNVQRGLRYTQGLYGSGGTMMTSGIHQALAVRPAEDTLRIVVFLTDGYIGNELDVLRLVEQKLGDARMYAFGVGTGVNRYLLSELGRVGRGFTRYMDPTEDVQEVARGLAARLSSPVLTDIEIDWGDMRPEWVTPSRIPDLFAGDSIRVQGRYAVPGPRSVQVRGRIGGREASLPLKFELAGPAEALGADTGTGPGTHLETPLATPVTSATLASEVTTASKPTSAIPKIWARSAVADAMHKLVTPRPRRPAMFSDEDIETQVTRLGLDFSLVTRWTAFVAVSEQVYNASAESTDTRNVPLPMVEGVSPKAYPAVASFGGYAAPEPGALTSLLLITGLLGVFVRLRGRRPARARSSIASL